jgi:Bax inhibitor 1
MSTYPNVNDYEPVKPPPFSPYAAVMKTDKLTTDVQIHCANVFAALAATLTAAALGVGMHLATACGGTLSAIAGVLAFLLLAVDPDKGRGPKRFGILMLFGLLQGMSLGELVAVLLEVDPHMLLVATIGTTVIFMCFSGAAMLAKRRSYLYLGATLSSAMSIMTLASVANIFFKSSLLMDFHLYAGLVMFCGYVIYDTQLIIERAVNGSRDVAWHAAELFVDFAAVFVRICVIMLKNAEKNAQKQKKREADSADHEFEPVVEESTAAYTRR